jgi:hypothetical protein
MTNTTPLPVGAIGASEWDCDRTRMFYGEKRGRVEIVGRQDHNGAVLSREGVLGVGGHFVALDSSALRQLAAAALDTAEELDALSGPSTVVIDLHA